MIIVDSNIVIDIATNDARWGAWSFRALERAVAIDHAVINDVVYAELSAGYRHNDLLDAALKGLRIGYAQIPKIALFLAGHAFRHYRRQRGTKTGVLPDFFIGAHAFAADARVLTRDPRYVRSYFPTVMLISP